MLTHFSDTLFRPIDPTAPASDSGTSSFAPAHRPRGRAAQLMLGSGHHTHTRTKRPADLPSNSLRSCTATSVGSGGHSSRVPLSGASRWNRAMAVGLKRSRAWNLVAADFQRGHDMTLMGCQIAAEPVGGQLTRSASLSAGPCSRSSYRRTDREAVAGGPLESVNEMKYRSQSGPHGVSNRPGAYLLGAPKILQRIHNGVEKLQGLLVPPLDIWRCLARTIRVHHH